MIRRHTVLLLAFLLLFFGLTGSNAQENTEVVDPAEANTIRRGESVVLDPTEVIEADFFATGESVRISGTVNGDVYVAGGNVIVDGKISGDLIAAGGTVEVTGDVENSLRVVGGQVSLSGIVGRNVSVIGGSTTLDDSAEINGNLAVLGGNVSSNAPIAGDATIGAGNLTVGNDILGDMSIAVGTLTMLENSSVQGNITYVSDEEIMIDEDKVAGLVTQKTRPQFDNTSREEVESPVSTALNEAMTFVKIISFISLLIVGLLLVHFFPRTSDAIVQTINERPWASLSRGFVILVISPFAIVALFITLAGIPLVILYAVGLAVVLYVSRVFVALWLSMVLAKRVQKKWHDGVALIIGLLLLTVLQNIPVFGWMVSIVAMLAGTGATFLTKQRLYHELRKKKLV